MNSKVERVWASCGPMNDPDKCWTAESVALANASAPRLQHACAQLGGGVLSLRMTVAHAPLPPAQEPHEKVNAKNDAEPDERHVSIR